ncbi:hypothetical protein GUJ93_ZPchr0007g5749 [Zizania palustris]|uniref:Uncharacterized protein n=1 Tax=Zizania palustris TaxID=103762 RepID=A0A8J5W552_ZIZPA|nr:hypothetical protein GUJ93_ZPchr0007g5749 [Zizania palustris]
MEERLRDRSRQPTVEEGEDEALSGEDSDGEFEFPFVGRETDAGGVADELFADGRIRAFYPVFGRVLDDAPVPERRPRPRLGRLFHEESRNSSVGSTSSSSSAATDAADIDGVSPDSYCLWIPGSSPASSPLQSPRKSGSTGSLARWRRISDLVIGRSHSDGKDKFLFLSLPSSPAREHPKAKPTKGGNKPPTEVETITDTAGHRMSNAPKPCTGAARRKTFLPYRQNLIFASRNHQRSF